MAVAFSMASSTLANAQEEDGKVNFSVQGDLVSSYIWRGFYQTGASFQPTLSLGVGNFSLTAWGLLISRVPIPRQQLRLKK